MNFDDNTTVSFDDNLTPVDYIRHIFDRTDMDGIAYIPGWHYDRPGWMTNAPGSTDENDGYCCRLNWSMRGRDYLVRLFNQLYADFGKIVAGSSRRGKCRRRMYVKPSRTTGFLMYGTNTCGHWIPVTWMP